MEKKASHDLILLCHMLMVEVFGEAGKHARAAVGSSSLPLGVAVEVEGVFQIK